MAEGIVNLVWNKLAEPAVKEILSLYGAGGKLDSLQHELRWIRSFLKDAETRKNLSEREKTWVNEVREVAYIIEDVIDTFIAEADDVNWPGMINAFNRILKLPIVFKLNWEVYSIHARLDEIKERTARYGIMVLGENCNAVPRRRPFREAVLPDVDDPDVIGLEKDKENIVDLLLDPNTPRRCVVSIVGQGGLGKTTLAKKAYNSDEVKRAFEFRYWLSISQRFKLIDLLRMMLEGIRSLREDERDHLERKDSASEQRAEEHFIEELNILLRKKRYLVIMDDVWTENLWIRIEKALPNVENGSRVLVTTRFSKIAKRADPEIDPYKLRFLSEEESQQLLLQKTFPYKVPKTFLLKHSDLLEMFAKKCGGLPLALIVVGCLLSIQEEPISNSWHKVLQKLSWQTDDENKCREILVTSYEDLPAVLKPCFMYFASFPEDYIIKAKHLIRMWVSEGLIPEENYSTLEERAEDYLEDLVQRSLIQVSERSWNGSIKYCRIHDLLRDLAIEKAKENNFLQIVSTQHDQSCNSGTIRRAAIHCNSEDIMKETCPKLRSLLSFGYHVPNVAGLRYLKVLYQAAGDFGCSNWIMSKEMTQLRYIGDSAFRDFLDFEHSIEFWKIISRMRTLQTLDLSNYQGDALADCIWNIKTLRHVLLSYRFEGPPSTTDLPNLQTLKGVKVREEWLVNGWPKIPNIRVLRLCRFPPKYNNSFHVFLEGLDHLSSLHINLYPSSYEVLDMSAFPSYEHMQSLHVQGKWDWKYCNPSMRVNELKICFFPRYLTNLTLWYSQFNEDPMLVLEQLMSLRKLGLNGGSYVGKQLSCSATGFPRLECLELHGLQCLEEWKVEKGGMPVLEEITIAFCPELVAIPDLDHITSINNISLREVHPGLLKRLEGDESYKIQIYSNY